VRHGGVVGFIPALNGGAFSLILRNDAAVEMLDLDGQDDLIGRSIFEFIHPDDREQARTELQTVIENKESAGPTKMKLRTADGDTRYVRISTAVGEFHGSDIGQAIVIDETEREERNQQLEALERWLRHNIRNEVQVISGMAESIEQGNVDDVAAVAGRIQDHATRLTNQAGRERQIIELLLDPPDPVPIELTALVEQQVAKSRAAHPAAAIQLSMADTITVEAIPTVGDGIRELIENAIKHSDTDPSTVHVEVTEDDQGRGRVSVTDNGPGIPQRERNNLLVDHDVTPLNHGTGVGLVFVHWMVRLSGGTVTIKDADPRGSTVCITF
jgi:PAS domain S-box-containing protein